MNFNQLNARCELDILHNFMRMSILYRKNWTESSVHLFEYSIIALPTQFNPRNLL